MKHTVEVKLPKLFGRKKVVNDTPIVRTEIEKDDIKEVVDEKVAETIEKAIKSIEIDTKQLKTIGVTLAVGFTAGYLKGNKDAIAKLAKQAVNIVVVK